MKKLIVNLFTPFHRVNKAAFIGTTAIAEIATVVMITQVLLIPKGIVLTLWYLAALFSLPTAIALIFAYYCVVKEVFSFMCSIRYLFR